MTAAARFVPVDLDEDDDDDSAAEIPNPIDWVPDAYVVAEVLASPRSFLQMTKLPAPDRAWLVAGLTVRGMTAEEIAARTHCSLRLIRTIRSWAMTSVCEYVHTQLVTIERELSGERSQHALTRRALTEAEQISGRKGLQLDQIVKALSKGQQVRLCPKKHPIVGYNKYSHTDHSGRVPRLRDHCRECNRERVAKCRAKQRDDEQASNASALQNLHTVDVTSAP